MHVSWLTFVKSESIRGIFDFKKVDFIVDLQRGDLLLKFFNNYRYFEMEDLPQEFFTKHSSSVQVLHNRREEITAGTYLVSINGIVSDGQQMGTRALLIIKNYILGLLYLYFGETTVFSIRLI